MYANVYVMLTTQSESLEQHNLRLRVLYNVLIKIADKAAKKTVLQRCRGLLMSNVIFQQSNKGKNLGKSGSRDTERSEEIGRKLVQVKEVKEQEEKWQELS